MVSDNQKKIRDINVRIEKAVEKIKENSYRIADNLALDIKKRVRLGYGVSGNDRPKQKLKEITDKTIEERRQLRKQGKLSPQTTPKRSNLTRTGQLTDGISPKEDSKKRIVVEIKENRNDGVLNSEIVDQQIKQGRPFFFVTDLERKRLQQYIKNLILRYIRVEFKK